LQLDCLLPDVTTAAQMEIKLLLRGTTEKKKDDHIEASDDVTDNRPRNVSNTNMFAK
jgi:hypothetical protein